MTRIFRSVNAKVLSKRSTQPESVCLLGASPLPPIGDYRWELYKLAEDYSQSNNFAAREPAKLKELQEMFQAETEKY